LQFHGGRRPKLRNRSSSTLAFPGEANFLGAKATGLASGRFDAAVRARQSIFSGRKFRQQHPDCGFSSRVL